MAPPATTRGSSDAAPAGPDRERKPIRTRFLDNLYPYGYIAPSVAFMVLASFLPIAFTIVISFTNYGPGHVLLGGGSGSIGWVGFQNFIDVFSNKAQLGISDFLHLFVWTVAFAAVTTALSFTGGLLLANLLNNENLRERNIYRTILIIPWAIPGAIAIVSWRSGIISYPFGLLHQIMQSVGLSASAQPQFLLDPNWARFAVFLVGFWFGYPFMMTACLGALQSISPEVLQAAEIDGANVFQKFFRVTLPLLRSATLPLIISTFAYNLNNFGAIYLLTGGLPACANCANGLYGYTDILPTAVYNLAYSQQLYYLAATFGVLLFFVIGGFSAINMKVSGAFEEVNR